MKNTMPLNEIIEECRKRRDAAQKGIDEYTPDEKFFDSIISELQYLQKLQESMAMRLDSDVVAAIPGMITAKNWNKNLRNKENKK